MEMSFESQTPPPIPKTEKMGNGAASASLMLGILSFAGLVVFAAIPAIFLGHRALSKIRKSPVSMRGRPLAVIGIVLGYLNIVLSIMLVAIAIPSLPWLHIPANEAAAIRHLRTLTSSQTCYAPTGNDSYAPDFASLTTARWTNQPACLSGNWYDGVQKDGYIFTMKGVDNGQNIICCYETTASPAIPGRTGVRYFFSDCSFVIRANKGAPADVTSPPIGE